MDEETTNLMEPGDLETPEYSDMDQTTMAEEEDLIRSVASPELIAPPADVTPTVPPTPTSSAANEASFSLPSVDDVKQVGQQVSDSAHQAVVQAKDTAGKAVEQAKLRAQEELKTRKGQAGDALDNFKQSVEEIGTSFTNHGQPQLGNYVTSLAGEVDRATSYLRNTEVDQIAQDAQEFARANPAIVLGGAFILGLALARFLKSTAAPASAASPGSTALVPVTSARQDIDLDDAFTANVHPIAAHGYVPGGVVGGASS